jgi:hypothetical protein
MPPGCSISPTYVLKLLFSEKYKIAISSTTAVARENSNILLESLVFYNFLMQVSLNLKTIKFYLIKFLATTKLFSVKGGSDTINEMSKLQTNFAN